MSKIVTVREVGGSWMIPLPKSFCEVVGIKLGINLELEYSKKYDLTLKIVEEKFEWGKMTDIIIILLLIIIILLLLIIIRRRNEEEQKVSQN